MITQSATQRFELDAGQTFGVNHDGPQVGRDACPAHLSVGAMGFAHELELGQRFRIVLYDERLKRS